MTSKSVGEQLIQELLANPSKFDHRGRAYQLLQEYFRGLPLETLRPLLSNEDAIVKKAAVWVVSELGKDASTLIHDVIPLLQESDRRIKYHALESVMVCSVDENVDEFVHVARALESDDEEIRRLAMRLIGNANTTQLVAAVKLLRSGSDLDRLHEQGLSAVLKAQSLDIGQIHRMIASEKPLVRKYGAIAAKRTFHKHPELIAAAASSADADVRQFVSKVTETRAN